MCSGICPMVREIHVNTCKDISSEDTELKKQSGGLSFQGRVLARGPDRGRKDDEVVRVLADQS